MKMVHGHWQPKAGPERVLASFHLFWRRAVLAAGFGTPAGQTDWSAEAEREYSNPHMCDFNPERLCLKH